MENLIFPAVIACACSLVLSAGALTWVLVFSPPAVLRKELDFVKDALVASRAVIDKSESDFRALRNEISAFEESVNGVLESVEKKRRRTAASESRANGGALEPQTEAEHRAAIRQKVYGSL